MSETNEKTIADLELLVKRDAAGVLIKKSLARINAGFWPDEDQTPLDIPVSDALENFYEHELVPDMDENREVYVDQDSVLVLAYALAENHHYEYAYRLLEFFSDRGTVKEHLSGFLEMAVHEKKFDSALDILRYAGEKGFETIKDPYRIKGD